MKYSTAEILQRLGNIPGWEYADGFLVKNFLFKDFSSAFGFMTRFAMVQEAMNHHANWSGVYNQVNLRLQTHEAGGITDKDFVLAQKAEALWAQMSK